MRSNVEPVGQKRPSFIEEARRRQIVETAIQTIARQGFSQASLAEIAKTAGISKGVISYHFGGKDELVEEILRILLKQPAEYIKRRVGEFDSALDKLTAYVEANFEFMEAHRDGYVALVDLWGRRVDEGHQTHFNADAYEPSRHYLARILEEGREKGEIRSLPARTTASLIQATIDGVMLQWVFDESAVDLDVASAEIVEMVKRHVSTQSHSQPPEQGEAS